MKKKLYFKEEEGEKCHSKEWWLEYLKESEEEEMTLFLAIPDKDKDYFYCLSIGEVCIKEKDTCGKECEDYNPCNGISGKCKYKTHCFAPSTKYLLLRNGDLIGVINYFKLYPN